MMQPSTWPHDWGLYYHGMVYLRYLLQLKSSDLKARAMQGTLQPLKALLDQAASSLSAPYVLHQVQAPQAALLQNRLGSFVAVKHAHQCITVCDLAGV